MTFQEIMISQEVQSGQEVAETYTPPAGSSPIVLIFEASAAFNVNVCCKLIWKYGTGSEKLLWTIKGESHLPSNIQLPPDEVDGVNSLAISLDNGGTGSCFLSAFARIGVG